MKLTQMLNAEWRRVVKRRIRGLTHADKRSLGIYSTIGAINNLANAAGWRPNTVIDIGANQGSWSLDVAREFPQATYLLIEPQQALEPQLSVACKSIGSNASYHIALLGAEARENVPFNFLGTGSSVLEETSGAKGDVASLVMRTLDDVLSGISFSTPALLKLDVQGYELEILKGAANTLAAAEIVMLETQVLPYNYGAPSFAEVVSFMSARGFSVYDLCDQLRRSQDGALHVVDVLFCRNESKLRALD